MKHVALFVASGLVTYCGITSELGTVKSSKTNTKANRAPIVEKQDSAAKKRDSKAANSKKKGFSLTDPGGGLQDPGLGWNLLWEQSISFTCTDDELDQYESNQGMPPGSLTKRECALSDLGNTASNFHAEQEADCNFENHPYATGLYFDNGFVDIADGAKFVVRCYDIPAEVPVVVPGNEAVFECQIAPPTTQRKWVIITPCVGNQVPIDADIEGEDCDLASLGMEYGIGQYYTSMCVDPGEEPYYGPYAP